MNKQEMDEYVQTIEASINRMLPILDIEIKEAFPDSHVWCQVKRGVCLHGYYVEVDVSFGIVVGRVSEKTQMGFQSSVVCEQEDADREAAHILCTIYDSIAPRLKKSLEHEAHILSLLQKVGQQ